jgi:hypothetical protein
VAKAKRARKKPGSRKSAPRQRAVARKKTAARHPSKRGAPKRKITARRAASRTTPKRKTTPSPSRLAAAATLVRGAAAGAVAAIARRLPWASDEPDPIVLLESDHRRFEDLLKEGEETTERGVKRRAELLEMLTGAFTVHEAIEERILYPALKAHEEATEIVLEGYQEHHLADLVINELHQLAPDDEKWGAKFKVLKESVEHHIQEEEREMFRIARAVLKRQELTGLGARMRNLKAELEA